MRKAIMLLMVLLFSAVVSADYYVSPSGADTGVGDSAHPWKTINYAVSKAANDSVIRLKTGNYGTVSITNNRTGWVTITPDVGAAVKFSVFQVKSCDAYLRLDSLYVAGTSADNRTIDILDASHVQIFNSVVYGYWSSSTTKLSAAGVRIRSSVGACSDIVISGCYIKDVIDGINIYAKIGSGIVILNNTVSHVAKSGISLQPANINSPLMVVKGNNISWQQSVIDGSDSSHGTGIAIRCSNLLIESNVVRYCGNTRGIRTYQSVMTYHDITLKDNLVYDCLNDLPVELLDCGSNIIVTGNRFIGRWDSSVNPGNTASAEKYNASMTILAASGSNGTGCKIENNIFVGYVSLGSTFKNYTQSNNKAWAAKISGTWTWFSSWGNSTLISNGSRLLKPDPFEAGVNCIFVDGTYFAAKAYVPKNGIDLTKEFGLK